MPSSRPASGQSREDASPEPAVPESCEPSERRTASPSESLVRILLVGFDSAWTAHNQGGLVAVLREGDGTIEELGSPRLVTYLQAPQVIRQWQDALDPAHTLILLDQPTIVPNATGQRPVESIAGSPIGRHGGGMQPSNESKSDMFGPDAPVWRFLADFGGAADPLDPVGAVAVFETYPALALIGLDWLLPGPGASTQLPKYNPANGKKFSLDAWRFVCERASEELRSFGLVGLPRWLDDLARRPAPRKPDQDGLDACLCLVVALHLADQKKCLMVGDMDTGYIVVPHGGMLASELTERCSKKDCDPGEWVREFRLAWAD